MVSSCSSYFLSFNSTLPKPHHRHCFSQRLQCTKPFSALFTQGIATLCTLTVGRHCHVNVMFWKSCGDETKRHVRCRSSKNIDFQNHYRPLALPLYVTPSWFFNHSIPSFFFIRWCSWDFRPTWLTALMSLYTGLLRPRSALFKLLVLCALLCRTVSGVYSYFCLFIYCVDVLFIYIDWFLFIYLNQLIPCIGFEQFLFEGPIRWVLGESR